MFRVESLGYFRVGSGETVEHGGGGGGDNAQRATICAYTEALGDVDRGGFRTLNPKPQTPNPKLFIGYLLGGPCKARGIPFKGYPLSIL